LSGRDRLESKLLDADEIAEIERDDVDALRLDRDFQHHIVIRIAQERPPQKVALPMVRDGTQKVEDDFDVRVRQAELARLSLRDGFILEHQRHGHTDLEAARAESLEERKRRPTPSRNIATISASVNLDFRIGLRLVARPKSNYRCVLLGEAYAIA